MIGIVAELILSWLLLKFAGRSDLSALGLQPTLGRIGVGLVGFSLAAVCCIAFHLAPTLLMHGTWSVNREMSSLSMLKSSLWTLRSVLFEELIFRGALLYLAIRRLGIRKACILSAVCFGVYHWFSYNLLGNWGMMAVIFVMTGIAGLMFAYSFAKTESLYLPIGLHFGWDLFNIVVFSSGPLGQQLLLESKHPPLQGIPSLLVFLFQIFALPVLVIAIWRRRQGTVTGSGSLDSVS